MDPTSLVMDELSAGAEFLNRLNARLRVLGACWLQHEDEGGRYLYVALDGLNDENITAGYREVAIVVRELPDYFDQFRVKLISPDNPIAQTIAELYLRFPTKPPTRLSGPVFGRGTVGDVALYPPIHATV